MDQMSIHIVPTDKSLYVRIVKDRLLNEIGNLSPLTSQSYIGIVGIVEGIAYSTEFIPEIDSPKKYITIYINGECYIFDESDVEYITKKEYFKGVLSGPEK